MTLSCIPNCICIPTRIIPVGVVLFFVVVWLLLCLARKAGWL